MAILSGVLAPLAVQAADEYSLRIERQPLARVLRELSEQTGLQIVAMFATDHGEASKPVGPLRGEFTAEAALQKLLADSDLTFARVNSNTISITSKPAPAKRAVQAPMPAKKFSPLSYVASAPAHDDVENVLVTGSHIRGARAAGSKLLMIGRDAIESSGQGRLPDALTTLSQNFHGVSEAYTQPTGVYNFNRGAEIQLRGLGPGTTLTLVNGQRQASGGQRGSMVDISSIATSAIERVEILPEGASALYGSDAIGGVINVILRKDFDGLETSVRGATAGGEADETQFAQLWGKTWSRGNVLIGYQYNERDPLRASARSYSAANDDLRAFGGSDYRVLGSNPGTILNAQLQPIAAIPAGQDGTNLTAAQLIPGVVNYADLSSRYWVLPEQKQHTAFMHGSFALTDNWEAFADSRYSSREFELHLANSRRNVTVPASNAFNRIGSTVRVAYDFADDLGVYTLSGRTETVASAAGVAGALSNDWQIKLTGGYAKERNASRIANGINGTALTQFLASSNPAVALNVFGDGSNTNPATLAALRSSSFEQSEWTTTSANVIVDGPLFKGPGGLVRGALGADFRREHLTHVNPAFNVARNVGRDVSAVFTEFAVPLLGPRNARSSESQLELSLAGRYEDYQDVGSTFDPKFGLGWRPLQALKFRGTWGTSFRAPPFHLADSQFQTSFAQVRSVVDPMSQATNGMSQVLVLSGARDDIKEETAEVWTAGVDFAVPLVDNLSIALTYFDIVYDDKIQYPGAHTTYLTQGVQ
ncbi:TonB-dependent receptor, partial [Steroidobacter sp.]|uniref:TonB-dependent receptor n=1 Tax=Steroidobacter sp. TaxID=1978227 RepID=UPI001A592E50